MTFDFGQLVMDADFNRMIRFAVGGIPVNDDTLSVDIIKEVGQFQDYLAHPNTYKHMRMYEQPIVMDRRMREDWTADGSMDMHEKAMITARDILKNHKPDPLSDHVLSELRTIVEEAEKEVKLNGK